MNSAIYLIAAHPDWRASRVNRLLLAAASGVPNISVCDLYSRYPDYFIDVAREQAALAAAQLVVLLHPIQWYSMPALQKLWLDEVLTHGWAYGTGGDALRGKDIWLAATTGGGQDTYQPTGYNRYPFEAFLPPYEQTAALCGMRFLPPLLLHGARAASEAEVAAHVATFEQQLQSYPNWPAIGQVGACPKAELPASARPTSEPSARG